MYIQASDLSSHSTAKSQTQSIQSLSFHPKDEASTLSILSSTDSRPPGCVVFAVSATTSVFLHVVGRVDFDGEIEKANKKLTKVSIGLEKQTKILDDPAKIEKMGDALVEVERKKLADLEAEKKGFEETIKQFEDLKLET